MGLDKNLLGRLKRFTQAFKDANERGANESDTVMFLVKFFEEVLGYDSLAGEISKEVSIKERYCDLALKLDGEIKCLVEAKAAGNKGLRDRDIEQAENYAARHGIPWVVLTNGVHWQLYHLSFNETEGEGIVHDLAFEFDLVELVSTDCEKAWLYLSLISKEGFLSDTLEEYWGQKKVLAPASLVRIIFSENVLTVIRRELNRNAPVRLDMDDVFDGLKELLSKDALLAAGEITMKKHRKRRRRQSKESAEENDSALTQPAAPTQRGSSAPAPGNGLAADGSGVSAT